MIIDLLVTYFIVILTLGLSVGVLLVYYFLDFILRKENRKELYQAWTLVLVGLIVHSAGHLTEAFWDHELVYKFLELLSLLVGISVMVMMSRKIFTYFSFVEVHHRLEDAVEDRTKQLEAANISMEKEIGERKKAEETLTKKLEELEKWHKLGVGRELRMIELKDEIKELNDKIAALKKQKGN
jgi:C4-dicarboxylate-specific signal transduction histidine kinase